MTEKAYWKDHRYQRHNVSRDVKTLCGWSVLLKLIEVCQDPIEKAWIAFLFETGGRISEVLALTISMLSICEDTAPSIIIIKGMPLRKQCKKTENYLQCLKCNTILDKGSIVCSKCGSTESRNVIKLSWRLNLEMTLP